MQVAKGRQVKPVMVTIEPAARRTIIQLVSATGKIQPETEVKISPEVAGEIIELPVIDGQIVKKGDLLIRIKPDTYKAQVAQQEAAITAAKAASLQSYAQLLKAQEDLKRYTDLYSRKVINDSDMTNYKTVAQVAEATYSASKAQVDQATSLLSQSKDLLEKTSIFSPIDGIISLLSVKQGERVVATGQFAGTEVMRVADLAQDGSARQRQRERRGQRQEQRRGQHRHRRVPQALFPRHGLPDRQHGGDQRREHPGGGHEFRGPHPHQGRGRQAAPGHERDRRRGNRDRRTTPWRCRSSP